jgi:hypothetical protein
MDSRVLCVQCLLAVPGGTWTGYDLSLGRFAIIASSKRGLMLPITDKSKQDEWETILAITKNNGYPTSMVHNLKTRLTIGKQNQKRQQQEENVSRRKWVKFTHFSPLIRRVTNLFKRTNLKVAFRATNTTQQQLTEKQTCKDPSGIYKLKCNT